MTMTQWHDTMTTTTKWQTTTMSSFIIIMYIIIMVSPHPTFIPIHLANPWPHHSNMTWRQPHNILITPWLDYHHHDAAPPWQGCHAVVMNITPTNWHQRTPPQQVWQPNGKQWQMLLFIVIIHLVGKDPPPPHSFHTNSGAMLPVAM